MSDQIEKHKRFLKLVVGRHLLDKETAQEIWKSADQSGKSVDTILIDRGILNQHIVDQLMDDVEKSFGPKTIGGFRITSLLGQGGMGSVYRAVQESIDREVALKVMASHFAKNKQAGDRFIREAKTAGKVNHPNVISIIDVGQENGQYYMALELVSGGDAEQLCHQHGGRLAEKRALEILKDACKGLQAIYQVGLVHRDIKPANIFISDDGTAKLADLGLARSEAGEDRMTQTGATVGTPAYMSPEQAEGVDDLDIRSDIYALGATLYAMVCGEPPYTGNSAWAVVAKAINDPVPDASLINNALSASCINLINDCMNKDRQQRIQSPDQLLERIEEALAHPVPSAGVSKAASPRTNKNKLKNSSTRSASKPGNSLTKKLLIAAAVLIFLALIMAGGDDEVVPVGQQASDPEIDPVEAGPVTNVEHSHPENNPDSTAAVVDEPVERERLLPSILQNGGIFLSQLDEEVFFRMEEGNGVSHDKYRQWTFGKGRFGLPDANGEAIQVNNMLFAHGLAMHPPSDNSKASVAYNIPKRLNRISGAVGLNDSSGPGAFKGELRFVILVPGKNNQFWTSEAINNENRYQEFDIKLPPGTTRIGLEVRCSGSFHFAQAVWLDPKLSR